MDISRSTDTAKLYSNTDMEEHIYIIAMVVVTLVIAIGILQSNELD